ncbi:MAG: nuclear transport factor 2 family protein [Pyrinomonadaceae bacterium]|nr:nuclear transport factor 2 family protein [Pyrinomonadaceae bacterium]
MEASTNSVNSGGSGQKQSLENLAARIQRLEAIKAIENLITRYAKASDKNNDPELMLPLFSEDGALDVGSGYGRYQGHEILRNFFVGTSSIISWSLHYNISPFVEVAEDGKTANAFWYLWELANMPDAKTGGEEAVWIAGSYTSDLVQEADGEWRFKEIRLAMEIMSPYSEGWVRKPWHDLGRPTTE